MDSIGFQFSDDGWPLQYDFDQIASSYERIYDEMDENPVQVEVDEAPLHQLDSDELVGKPRVFTPPLQYQRNAFVRDILYAYNAEGTELIRKLAVLGCGALSLERFMILLFGTVSIERVISVDIDEHEIAKGLKLFSAAEHQNQSVICCSNSLPILIEVYVGDILEYDERLAGTECVCSIDVIEHIPVEDATRYVRSVLANIHPKLFIISTPNHEYNEAFGLPVDEFRHTDHKFEFTRHEFRSWLYGIVRDFDSVYDYAVQYVGNVQGYYRLGGATQFGIIRRKRSVITRSPVPQNSKPYKKAGDFVIRNSLFPLEREKLKKAFIEWLERNPLTEEHLVRTGVGDYWRVCITTLLNDSELPMKLKATLDKKILFDVLKFQCKGLVVHETYNNDIYLNIPHNVTKEELINVMIKSTSPA